VPVSLAQRWTTALAIRKRILREYAGFDSAIGQCLLAVAGLTLAALLRLLGKPIKAVSTAAAVHRAAYTRLSDRLSWAVVARQLGLGATLSADYIATYAATAGTERFFADPQRLLGTRILVLKSPSANERGILVLDYSFVFPLFARLFDVEAIARRYFLVFEPSWSGYCDLDILCYSTFTFPVFVQSAEPRDSDVLRRAGNFVPIPIAANWWIDHRIIHPVPGTPKTLDVVMIASWAAFKRHHRVFKALQTLRRRGHVLTMALAGYPSGLQKNDILRMADYYGVGDQIEVHEWLSFADVNGLYNRARVNLVWSRREGCNRAIIEGMLADVPCIIRTGFNYGFRPPHINPATGRFCDEKDLPDTLLEFCSTYDRYHPRAWVLAQMSCQAATAALTTAIRPVALSLGEVWTRDPVVKVGALNRMAYWDEPDRERFAADYAFLSAARRGADHRVKALDDAPLVAPPGPTAVTEAI
jgi:hypothetical protein